MPRTEAALNTVSQKSTDQSPTVGTSQPSTSVDIAMASDVSQAQAAKCDMIIGRTDDENELRHVVEYQYGGKSLSFEGSLLKSPWWSKPALFGFTVV